MTARFPYIRKASCATRTTDSCTNETRDPNVGAQARFGSKQHQASVSNASTHCLRGSARLPLCQWPSRLANQSVGGPFGEQLGGAVYSVRWVRGGLSRPLRYPIETRTLKQNVSRDDMANVLHEGPSVHHPEVPPLFRDLLSMRGRSLDFPGRFVQVPARGGSGPLPPPVRSTELPQPSPPRRPSPHSRWRCVLLGNADAMHLLPVPEELVPRRLRLAEADHVLVGLIGAVLWRRTEPCARHANYGPAGTSVHSHGWRDGPRTRRCPPPSWPTRRAGRAGVVRPRACTPARCRAPPGRRRRRRSAPPGHRPARGRTPARLLEARGADESLADTNCVLMILCW